MNFSLFELLYNIPELQDAYLAEVWQACRQLPDPEAQALFDRLEDAIHFDGALQERASFFTGIYLGWGLARTMGA